MTTNYQLLAQIDDKLSRVVQAAWFIAAVVLGIALYPIFGR
jgi:hypothetical protein